MSNAAPASRRRTGASWSVGQTPHNRAALAAPGAQPVPPAACACSPPNTLLALSEICRRPRRGQNTWWLGGGWVGGRAARLRPPVPTPPPTPTPRAHGVEGRLQAADAAQQLVWHALLHEERGVDPQHRRAWGGGRGQGWEGNTHDGRERGRAGSMVGGRNQALKHSCALQHPHSPASLIIHSIRSSSTLPAAAAAASHPPHATTHPWIG